MARLSGFELNSLSWRTVATAEQVADRMAPAHRARRRESLFRFIRSHVVGHAYTWPLWRLLYFYGEDMTAVLLRYIAANNASLGFEPVTAALLERDHGDGCVNLDSDVDRAAAALIERCYAMADYFAEFPGTWCADFRRAMRIVEASPPAKPVEGA